MEQLVLSIITLFVGAAVFIVGMNMMSSGLKKSTGRGLKRLLKKIRNNRFACFGIGTTVTALVQSSAATGVMAIGFIAAGAMTVFQGVNIILGAYVGTTITGFLAALSTVKIAKYFVIVAAIGVIYMLTKNLLLTIAGAHAEKNNEEAEVADSVKATESEGGLDEFPTASELQYDPLRAMLRDDFCGPDDCIYKQLRKDLAEILTNPDVRGTTTRIGEIAYKLYMPTKGETAKLVDKEYMLVFGKWLPKFCDIIGIETPKDTRQNKYEEFHEVNGLPMRYLFASSFDDFKDPVLVKKYLRD